MRDDTMDHDMARKAIEQWRSRYRSYKRITLPNGMSAAVRSLTLGETQHLQLHQIRENDDVSDEEFMTQLRSCDPIAICDTALVIVGVKKRPHAGSWKDCLSSYDLEFARDRILEESTMLPSERRETFQIARDTVLHGASVANPVFHLLLNVSREFKWTPDDLWLAPIEMLLSAIEELDSIHVREWLVDEHGEYMVRYEDCT